MRKFIVITLIMLIAMCLSVVGEDLPGIIFKAQPMADFKWSPETQDEGMPVGFTDSSSDADGTVVLWSWDFDSDGTEDSSLQNPSYTYMDNGLYIVTLTVTDNDGLTDIAQNAVKVSNVAPVVDAGPGDLEVQVRQPVSISVDFSDKGAADTHTAIVNWGDGTPVDNIDPAISPMSASHIYLVAGEFNVVITVTDNDGGAGSDTLTVTVIPIIEADVDFGPDTLHVPPKNHGNWITCYLSFMDAVAGDFDLDGNLDFVVFCPVPHTPAPIPSEDSPTDISYNEDTKESTIMVKFNKQAVQEQVKECVEDMKLELPAEVPAKVEGLLALKNGDSVRLVGFGTFSVK